MKSSSIFPSWFPQTETELLPGWWGTKIIQSSKNSVRQGEQRNLRRPYGMIYWTLLSRHTKNLWKEVSFPRTPHELLATNPIRAWGTQPVLGPAASREAQICWSYNNWPSKLENKDIFLASLWAKPYNMQFSRHPMSRGQCNVLESWFY